RGGAALEGENGERTGRQEMLLGAATVIALMLDRRHDARLRIVPPAGGDAGAPADPGTGAVSGNQEPRRDHAAVGKLDIDMMGRTRVLRFALGRRGTGNLVPDDRVRKDFDADLP